MRRAATAFPLSFAAVIAAPQSGRADTVLATLTGKFTSGTDFTGVFGFPPKTDLTGKPYKLVISIDDSKGYQSVLGTPPYYSYIEYNSLTGVGGTNPTTASLVVNGHATSFGTLPHNILATTVSRHSGVKDATFSLVETYSTAMTTGQASLQATIWFDNPVYTPNYSWESSLAYRFAGPDANTSGSFVFDRQTYTNYANGTLATNADAQGAFTIDFITVSGPVSAACLRDVSSGINSPTLSGSSDSSLPTTIRNKFTPDGGIDQAESDCDVSGFNWSQTVVFPPPGNVGLICSDITCSPRSNAVPGTIYNDPPKYGWVYCFSTFCKYYPYVYKPSESTCALESSLATFPGVPPITYCSLRLQDSDYAINFDDTPSNTCLLEPNTKGVNVPSPKYSSGECSSTYSKPGATMNFVTQLVGVPSEPGATPVFLPYIFTWSSSYNLATGGITVTPSGH